MLQFKKVGLKRVIDIMSGQESATTFDTFAESY